MFQKDFSELQSTPPIVDAAWLDGSIIVNMIKPKKNQSFEIYYNDYFISELKKYSDAYCAERTDLVFDRYTLVCLNSCST